jgi:hypothetical protein
MKGNLVDIDSHKGLELNNFKIRVGMAVYPLMVLSIRHILRFLCSVYNSDQRVKQIEMILEYSTFRNTFQVPCRFPKEVTNEDMLNTCLHVSTFMAHLLNLSDKAYVYLSLPSPHPERDSSIVFTNKKLIIDPSFQDICFSLGTGA